MTWRTYYNKFNDWADSTKINSISLIDDFSDASAKEIEEIADALYDKATSSQLILRAMDYGVRFTSTEILELIFYVDEDSRFEFASSATTEYTKEQLNILGLYLPGTDMDIFYGRKHFRNSASKPFNISNVKSKRKNNGLKIILLILFAPIYLFFVILSKLCKRFGG